MLRRLLWPALAALLLLSLAAGNLLSAPRLSVPTRLPNDPRLSEQWGLGGGFGIHATDAWTLTTGADITIAVLDSGFDLAHPDLVDRWESPYNFLEEDGVPAANNWTDNYGTAIAGIIAATADNAQGISGVTWRTRIMPLRVVNREFRDGTGAPLRLSQTARFIVDGLNYAVQHGARIVVFGFNMPNFSESDRDQIQRAIQRLQDPLNDGYLVVIAPVGERPTLTPYPAALNGVIGVTGVMTDGLALGIRSTGQTIVPRGPFVDLAAPAESILAPYWDFDSNPPQQGYRAQLGTEFATGFVAGAAALVLSMNPNLPPSQVETILRTSATDLGDPGPDDLYGAGLVNALAAVQGTRHYLSVQPNSLSLPPMVGATATLTNPYTLAASWRVLSAPEWLSVATPTDSVSFSTARVTLQRVPTCAEMTAAQPILLASTLPTSFSDREIAVQVAGVCASSTTPTPQPTRTATPVVATPPPSQQLFLPHIVHGCKNGICPR
ncbi:MAG: S8 family serine peptidase [Anaerolineae bacterium]|nr:S8 family serine peptidase [Anaerolineae bacterium]